MTVEELIEKLRGMPAKAKVSLHDVAATDFFEISGFQVLDEDSVQIEFNASPDDE